MVRFGMSASGRNDLLILHHFTSYNSNISTRQISKFFNTLDITTTLTNQDVAINSFAFLTPSETRM